MSSAGRRSNTRCRCHSTAICRLTNLWAALLAVHDAARDPRGSSIRPMKDPVRSCCRPCPGVDGNAATRSASTCWNPDLGPVARRGRPRRSPAPRLLRRRPVESAPPSVMRLAGPGRFVLNIRIGGTQRLPTPRDATQSTYLRRRSSKPREKPSRESAKRTCGEVTRTEEWTWTNIPTKRVRT